MWNPKQYNKYQDYRTRPAIDLIHAIPDLGYRSIVDLGCGSGHITQMLVDQFQPDNVLGLDSAEAMLAQARSDFPHIRWQLGDIAQTAGNHDLVFSNAALQWLPDHAQLFLQLLKQTNKVLAIQMPNNFQAPSHVLLRETIHEDPLYRAKLQAIVRADPVMSLTQYHALLSPFARHIDLWESSYLQQLDGEDPVLEWVKGTALVPVEANLSADEFAQFKERYRRKLREAYPQNEHGVTLFPFSRLFMVVVK